MEAIFDWYERRQPGLGSDFAAQLDQDLAQLIDSPRMAPPWKGPTAQQLGVRVAVMRRYPFVLPYLAREEWVVVLAVAHVRKRPGYWLRRLKRHPRP
ncbi:type II toxin-antitoxin system RelE/ParE family toxin [Pyxidicoccus parkwayensis]|uniref:Type II toxin-antitoxin system RelE/ParE family toxin n=1 Tax=Pyxidicoccus parkwayensis TaxID=2813578 RepID=A0ABX7NUT2_9BACT|nr:type II toxin-antitoxin system RelE/ParE family toxin [Pyxidicoccus parkwaysis]